MKKLSLILVCAILLTCIFSAASAAPQWETCKHSFKRYSYNHDGSCDPDHYSPGTMTAQCSKGCGAQDTIPYDGFKPSHNAPSHMWGDFKALGDGTHKAACERGNCDEVLTVACTYVELSNGDAICPVCGTTKNGDFLPLVDFCTYSRIRNGELLMRLGNLSDGTRALIVCIEKSGEVLGISKQDIRVPLSHLKGYTLTKADGTEVSWGIKKGGENAIFTLDKDAGTLVYYLNK